MFTISNKIATYARIEKYYISTFMYKSLYAFACIVRVLELSVVLGFVYLIAVVILSL